MATPNIYGPDTTVQVSGTFTAISSGEPVNPSVVILYVSDPSGDVAEYTGDELSNPSTGLFTYNLLLDAIGVWTYKFQGSEGVNVTSPDTNIVVAQTIFSPPL